MAESGEQEENPNRKVLSSSGGFDYTCQPCSGDDKHVEAAGFCVDCSEFLCSECFKYHPKPVMFKNHQLVDIEQVKKGEFSIYRDVCNTTCPDHRGETIKYYCNDHESLACGVCINLDHRTCPGVQYIPKVSESMTDGEELSSVIQELNTIVQRTKDITQASKSNLTKTQEAYSKTLEEVKQVTKDVTEALEKLQKKIEAEAEKLKLEHTEEMDTNIALCDDIQNKAETMVSNLKRLKEGRQNCNLFVAMKTEKQIAKSLVEKLDQVSDKNCIGNYLFRPSKYLQEFQKHKGTLGKLLQQRKKVATKVGKICVKTDNDTKTCSIYGSVILPNQRMVVADNGNKKIKLMDLKQSKVINELQVPDMSDAPWAITKTSKEAEIVVTLGNVSQIYLLSVKDDRLCKDGEVKTSSSCYGLASIKDNFIVSLMQPERLEIIDRQGNVLQKLQTDKKGKSIFEDIRSVTVNIASETIYVADFHNETVTCLSLSMQVKSVHEEMYIKEARGVAIDKRGNVYVCWEAANIISQLTSDLKESCLILSSLDGLVSPLSMGYCVETDRLYVGQKNTNTMLVYKLS